jgi:hypothetical protein
MTVFIPIASMSEAENLAAQRPDLFAIGKAVVSQDDTGQWQIAAPDDIAAELEALNAQDATVRLSDYSGRKRWSMEVGGITSGGYPIRTDADSQRKTATLNADFQNGVQTDPVQFKLADGSFVQADAVLVKTFSDGIQAHIQTCYDAEQSAYAGIIGGTVLTNDDVDAFYASIPILPAQSAVRRK